MISWRWGWIIKHDLRKSHVHNHNADSNPEKDVNDSLYHENMIISSLLTVKFKCALVADHFQMSFQTEEEWWKFQTKLVKG